MGKMKIGFNPSHAAIRITVNATAAGLIIEKKKKSHSCAG